MNFDVKAVEGLLYGWGEWRLKKGELNGYSNETITGLLMKGAINFGKQIAHAVIPFGVTFEGEGRAMYYQLIEGYYESLSDKHKAVMLAYYSVYTKGTCTDEERAVKLGLPKSTMLFVRANVRDRAYDYLSGIVFFR